MDGAEYREYRERRGSRDICKSLKRLTTAAYSLLSLFGQKIGNTHTHIEWHVERRQRYNHNGVTAGQSADAGEGGGGGGGWGVKRDMEEGKKRIVQGEK